MAPGMVVAAAARAGVLNLSPCRHQCCVRSLSATGTFCTEPFAISFAAVFCAPSSRDVNVCLDSGAMVALEARDLLDVLFSGQPQNPKIYSLSRLSLT